MKKKNDGILLYSAQYWARREKTTTKKKTFQLISYDWNVMELKNNYYGSLQFFFYLRRKAVTIWLLSLLSIQ